MPAGLTAVGSPGNRAGAEGAGFGFVGTPAGFVGWLGGRAVAGGRLSGSWASRAAEGPGGLRALAERRQVG